MTISDKYQAENTLDDGELTMEELERMAGGADLPNIPNLPNLPNIAINPDFSLGDVVIQTNVQMNMDSSYSSYSGTTGSTSSIGSAVHQMPMNMTHHFP